MKIIKNPNWSQEQHEKFALKVKNNDGYCPCRLLKKPENKCICKEFLENQNLGECHCGRFTKTEI